ncbi:hypothetical protein LshimejAT787_0504300 [Lyophyllum shimeji]|uniref:Uncharacterized protein n=1 Tax=Lyophyllum shimeji TaxID=47721 RepID=A0A9P3PLJ7_LYOSH|nr:hypothetical protein LshimejAT787_0504300 [Lyophyllum shimeji]
MASQDNSNANISTTSLLSTTTATSTSPLNATPKVPPKDYAAALATLQSRFGTGGHLPTPKGGVKSSAATAIASTPSDSTLTSVTAPSSLVSDSSNNTSAGGSGVDVKKKGFISTVKNKFKSG